MKYIFKKVKRDRKGRFTNTKNALWLSFFLVLPIIAIIYLPQAKADVKTVDKVVVLDTTSSIIAKEKADILDTLQGCESKGDITAIAWEDNGTGKNRASFGVFMLKVGTIQNYVKGLSDFQALALASDQNESRKLAEQIIFNTDGGIYNWKNCMIKHNLLSRVNFVKELEKKNNSIKKD